jgi:NagD protein
MLVGTNPDRTCPMPGYDLPDAACMIAAIEACTEKKVEPVVGKPSRIMLEEVLALLKLPVHSCVMVGDRCGTDMVMAENAGLRSVLVLSGVTGETDLKDRPVHPDVVLESVAEFLTALE